MPDREAELIRFILALADRLAICSGIITRLIETRR